MDPVLSRSAAPASSSGSQLVPLAAHLGSFQSRLHPRLAHPSTAERRGVCTAALVYTSSVVYSEEQEEEDAGLANRENWYTARFIAEDAPDWNPGRFLRSEQTATGLRNIVLEAEISREKVPLRNAYKHVCQKASVRVNSGPNRELTVASAPFSYELNRDALFKAKGDISAGEIKFVKDEIIVRAELHLLVDKDEAEEVYNLSEDDSVEIGPFVGSGIDVRPMQSIYAFPTLIIFAEGRGIAGARALIEAANDAAGLDLNFRQDVRMYYRAPNQDAFCYKELFEEWASSHNCQVITGTRETFMDLFDNDDTLTYEPATTAALIFTGGDEEAEKAALEVCKEAEIETIARDSQEQVLTLYLKQGASRGQV